jgi:hypothetical protein
LLGGIRVECAGVRGRIDQMGADVVFDHLRHQARDRPANASDQVHNALAASFGFKPALDGIDLAADATHARQQLLFFANSVCHPYSIR